MVRSILWTMRAFFPHVRIHIGPHWRPEIRLVCLYVKTMNLPTLIVYGVPRSETCIKGHRSSSCRHTDRPLFEIKKKGRPVTQCEHCRELRKTKQVHVKCMCGAKELSPPQHEDTPPTASSSTSAVGIFSKKGDLSQHHACLSFHAE